MSAHPTDPHEKLDLSHNGSADPKPINFEELPAHILRKILQPVDIRKRLEIRKLSKKLRFVVDQLKTHYDEVTINCDKNSISVSVKAGDSKWKKKWSEEIANGHFMEYVIHGLRKIMDPKKLRVDQFQFISHNFDHLKTIVDLFGSISKTASTKFHVKSASIKIRDSQLALSVLSLMKPGVLEGLDMGCFRNPNKEIIDLEQLKIMDQFKQAKTVSLFEFGVIRSTDLAIFASFEGFDVLVQSTGPEDVRRLRDMLSNSDKFKRCSIQLQTPIPIENIVGIARVIGKRVPNWWFSNVKHSWAIPKSNKYIHFSIGDDIEVEVRNSNPREDSYPNSDDYDSDDTDFDN